jgi:hypothetical protein
VGTRLEERTAREAQAVYVLVQQTVSRKNEGEEMLAVIEGVVRNETQNAIQINSMGISGKRGDFWIPKSQISYSRKTPSVMGQTISAEIPVWLAIDKGIDYGEKE